MSTWECRARQTRYRSDIRCRNTRSDHMPDAVDAFIEKWEFDAKDREYLARLVKTIGDPQVLDDILERYPMGVSSRAAVHAMWSFVGKTYRQLALSPEAMDAAVRFMVVSHESGAGLDHRTQILKKILSPWGLGDAAAMARAEKKLMEVAGPQVSNDALIERFLTLRKQCLKAKDRPDSSEARRYLKKHPGASVFATNRFGGRSGAAAAFVDSLDAAGATTVTIENISFDDETASGQPHADSMTVELPRDAAARERVFKVINEEGSPEDAPIADRGESSVGLWWD